MALAVMCVTKVDRDNPWERIINIGGVGLDGRRWKISQDRAIEGIENGKWQFYVERPGGDRVNVIVAVGQFNHKYVTTNTEGDQLHDLLSLPECP